MMNELYHHGILDQKWGVRRYQNYDGSLTAAGKERYGSTDKLSSSLSGGNLNNANSKKKSTSTGKTLLKSAGVEAGIIVGRNLTSNILGRAGMDVVTTTGVTRLAAAGATAVNAVLIGKKVIANRRTKKQALDESTSGGSLFSSKANKKANKNATSAYEEMYVKAHNNAATRMNGSNGLIAKLNKKYENDDVSDHSTGIGKQYVEEYQKIWNQILEEEMEKLS
ncbi:MAG: hypothetical protein LUF89_02210 [Ruminococcus sp.]|nr:hypothetical protein [Ruminococcus sp.]